MMVTNTSQDAQKLMRKVTMFSLAVAVCLLIGKTVAWVMTGSVAIQASLVDSLVDSIATAINFIAIRKALEPADDEHRFGHGKIESVAALGQSVFIAGAAFWVAMEAIMRFVNPEPVTATTFGIVTIIVTLILTVAVVGFQAHVIKKSNSAVVKADYLHYKGDVLLNISVILSLLCSRYFELNFIDPLCGLAIAVYISWTSWKIASQSLDILIDRELPDAEKNIVEEIVKSHDRVVGFHDLKTRSSGQNRFIQLHLEMDGNLTLDEAHDISVEVANQICEKIPQTEVLIHQDPFDDRHLPNG